MKDGASAVIENTLFRDCETALHVYDKTTGSGGHAAVSSSIFEQCGSDVFVEEGTASVQWSISDGGLIPGQGNVTGDPSLDSQGRLLHHSLASTPVTRTGKTPTAQGWTWAPSSIPPG